MVSPCPEPHLDLPGLERGPASSHDGEYSGGSGVGDRTPVHATHSIKNPIPSPLFGGGGSGNHFTVEHKTVLSCVVTCHFPPRAGFLFLPLFFIFFFFYVIFSIFISFFLFFYNFFAPIVVDGAFVPNLLRPRLGFHLV